MRICSIDQCNKKHFGKGFCNAHYVRMRRHGSPFTIKKFQNGGRSTSPLYKTYNGMLARCSNPKEPGYKNYGGRGIKVSARWRGIYGFINFVTDMGPKPSKQHSLDRIDNNRGYSPDNCRWADRSQQALNRRVRSTNKSGVTGVHWYPPTGKWKAQLMIRGELVLSAYFGSYEEAVFARKKAELKFIK